MKHIDDKNIEIYIIDLPTGQAGANKFSAEEIDEIKK